MKHDLDFLGPWFLSPAAENDKLLEELLLEFVRDHVYWRRNFHPEDGQRISPAAQHAYLLRHTLMNPWLLAGPGDRNYVDLYWDYLVEVVEEVLREGTWGGGGATASGPEPAS